MVNPVVVVGPPSYNGGDASTIRVSDVNPQGFKVRIQEFQYQKSKTHTEESANWLAVEAGEWVVTEDVRISAGSAFVEAGGDVASVSYSTFFAQAPAAVLAGVSSDNNPN